ncbi:DNA-processing protein DprA [Streptomyces sp. NPDC058953]|uniref:DNA-processing protein DprA n=1 Tax=unclassified Streptomyces TaxID=2593676 RepID=UPI00368D417E
MTTEPPPGQDPEAPPGRDPEAAHRPVPETGRRDEAERLARAVLTRVVEPGDPLAGRWLADYGAVALLHRITAPDDPATRAEPPLPGATPRRLVGYRARAATADPHHDLAAIAAIGGRFICPGDPEWPTQLDDLGPTRPIGLWARGTPHLRTWALRSVALVGARACTPYGTHVAGTLAAELAHRGWVVISGAAFGIDGAAHRGALAAGGATVAVLACGVDVAYPPGHTELIHRIAEQGLVVAELAPGDHPTRSRFVLRNRVIAALTRGTVVIEAAYRSGSLVTARRARELGRHIMGVPGPTTSTLSAGVHELLRGDGTLVTDADDIVELVGTIGELAPARRGPVHPRDLLTPRNTRILEALPARGAARPADLARTAGTGTDDTLTGLYELHALGFVERGGEGWQLTRGTSRESNTRRGGS